MAPTQRTKNVLVAIGSGAQGVGEREGGQWRKEGALISKSYGLTILQQSLAEGAWRGLTFKLPPSAYHDVALTMHTHARTHISTARIARVQLIVIYAGAISQLP